MGGFLERYGPWGASGRHGQSGLGKGCSAAARTGGVLSANLSGLATARPAIG
jgi:hypothetical protein